MNLLDSTEKLRRDRSLIEVLIEDPSRLGPDYQPVVRFSDGAVVAHKATGRGASGTDLESTLELLESAKSTGLVERLDWAFRCLALEQCLEARLSTELHLTPEPETYGSACPPRLASTFARGNRELRVAAELHADGLAHPRLDSALREWRGWGWRIVVTDVSTGVDAHLLRTLDHISPDVLQVDVSQPSASGGQVRELLEWAAGREVEVHATGVDLEARRALALDLGAVAGRGRLLGAPGPLAV
ncbi:MAG TPA: EAL domain-containing protein [Mycobacteriales bacterium]|nr:EAL domain-containing protein [Mycobacteriales bacterium]